MGQKLINICYTVELHKGAPVYELYKFYNSAQVNNNLRALALLKIVARAVDCSILNRDHSFLLHPVVHYIGFKHNRLLDYFRNSKKYNYIQVSSSELLELEQELVDMFFYLQEEFLLKNNLEY
jgi:hypothetical protein